MFERYSSFSTNLPKSPTLKQQRELLIKMADGEKAAREELIVRNLRLVVFIAKKYESTNIPIEELVSIGTIGLIKSIDSYSLDKGTMLATYASRCITNEILMFLRKAKKYSLDVSINEELFKDVDGNVLEIEDILADTKPEFIDEYIRLEEAMNIISSIINDLTTKQKIILLYFLSGLTQKEIGKNMNFSQSYVSRILNASKKKIRKVKSLLVENKMYRIYIIDNMYELYISKDKVKSAKDLANCIKVELQRFKIIKNVEIKELNGYYAIDLPVIDETYIILVGVVKYIEC